MSQFFRKGGITLNDTEWIQDFADRRLQYGVSQTKLAVMAGISREHLSRIESGKVAVTEEMKVKLLEALEKFNPEAPLTMLFDYVRIRFPTLDIGHIIKDILQLCNRMDEFRQFFFSLICTSLVLSARLIPQRTEDCSLRLWCRTHLGSHTHRVVNIKIIKQ